MKHDWEPLTDECSVCSKCGNVANEIDASPEEWDGACTPDPILLEG